MAGAQVTVYEDVCDDCQYGICWIECYDGRRRCRPCVYRADALLHPWCYLPAEAPRDPDIVKAAIVLYYEQLGIDFNPAEDEDDPPSW
jgi:hypothetical protein